MPNLVKENRFFYLIKGFSPMMRFFVSFIILISILLIWMLFFYLPVNLELKKETLLFNDYLVRKNIYQKALVSFGYLENENKKLSESCKKNCVKNCNAQKILHDFLKLLEKYELTCSELVPIENKQTDICNKEYYGLKAKGSFIKMLSLLTELNEYEENLKIKEVEFLRKKHGKVLLDAKIRLAFFKP